MDRCWILLDAFFHLLRWSCAFVFFCCWCGVSHWSLYPCPKDVSRMRHDESNFVSRMNPTWLWYMIFVGFSLLIFRWEFLCLYSSKILACTWLCYMIFVGFSLLIFCREFLCLYSSKILACNFLFFVVFLSGFGIRMMEAS